MRWANIFKPLGAPTVKSKPSLPTPPADLAASFYQLRPVIETGWEMPVLIRALVLGITEAKMRQDWAGISAQLLKEAELTAADIGTKLDQLGMSGLPLI